MTVFLSILNRMEFYLVQNRKEYCHHDHIPFNVKENGSIVFSVCRYYQEVFTVKVKIRLYYKDLLMDYEKVPRYYQNILTAYDKICPYYQELLSS